MEQIFLRPTLDDWAAREAIPFAVDSLETVSAAVDKMMASLDDGIALLGFGEALHSGKDLLILRNRLFQCLVEAHGYSPSRAVSLGRIWSTNT
jgi:erythromycin esterase-like protein